MNKTNNPKLTGNAKELRKNMTKEERRLWYDFLKKLPVTVNRQKVIGDYIADFYCASAKLVIELDGSQHYEDAGIEKDLKRDSFFGSRGYMVKRYTNTDINQRFDAVCEELMRIMEVEPVSW